VEGNEYKEVLQLYDKLEAENEKKKKAGVHDYSLINALLKASDEVNLHSKFIYSMINPAGLHYCESAFLKLFLEEIKSESFFDSKAVEVFREKGNIDLLIHDGNKFIIIENKLNAIDQEYQITRYIKYVKDRFLPYEDDLSDKIKIVYLAKNKSYPSNHSLIGFKRLEDKNVVEWIGIDKDIPEKLTGFTLKSGTKIPYIHINYQNNIQHWVSESRKKDACKSKNLIHVFDEYELILKRLNSKKSWRNIMGLSEHYIGLKDTEKEKMYQFMVESRDALPKLIRNEILELFDDIFDEGKAIRNPEFKFFSKERKDISVDDFSESCLKWINKTGRSKGWRDVGFLIYAENGDVWRFLMGYENIFFEKIELIEGEKSAAKHKVSGRDALLKRSGLGDLRDKIKGILEQIKTS